ncbi:MAG: hypothetical protein ACO3WU_01915 [Ilumatobacteraceae bacterium]
MNRAVMTASALAGALIVLVTPTIAHADPAGPTDFETTIVSISPDPDGVVVSVEGGDSFLRVEVEPGHSVEVPGYDGEPYLRIRRDGTVERNRRSFATYYNDDRYGDVDIPAFVDGEAPPEWETVGRSGAWAWHDHRAHWMGTEPPIGLEPGESLPAQTVPILVDGTTVSIVVVTTLVAAPSPLPLLGIACLVGVIALLGVRTGPAVSLLLMATMAALAVVVGLGQWVSLPAETGRSVSWWLLPASALLALVVAVASFGRSWMVVPGATTLAATQVLLWALARRDGLTSPVLPTSLPIDLDRGVTAAVLAGSVMVGLASAFRLVRPAVRR